MNLLNFVFIIQTQLPGEAIPEGQNKHLPNAFFYKSNMSIGKNVKVNFWRIP